MGTTRVRLDRELLFLYREVTVLNLLYTCSITVLYLLYSSPTAVICFISKKDYFDRMFLFSRFPPCPGNPDDYQLVVTREGKYWRKKRGRVRPANLNYKFQGNTDVMSVVSPAARRVMVAMEPFMRGIRRGRLNNRISSAFRKSLEEEGCLRLSYLKGLEFQREHPMDLMVRGQYPVLVSDRRVRVELDSEKIYVEPQNPLVTDFYFELVLLYGNVNEDGGLRTECVDSPLFAYRGGKKTVCVLELDLPEEGDWCAILKVSSLEDKQVAMNDKNYRMRVMEGGEKGLHEKY